MRKLVRSAVLLAMVACPSMQGAETALDPAPSFSEEERSLVRSLSPSSLPAPPTDRTNRFADDPRAARFGQRLFFDPRFSGRLLEGDNDGSPHTLGRKGETGKVACAGCHIPESGFLDSRSLGHAISLAAAWGRRHAPSLYDVGQVRLLMWDGRRDTLQSQIFEVIESHVEMNSSRLFAAQQLSRLHRSEYEAIFGKLPDFNDPRQFPQLTAEETGCRPAGTSPGATCDGVVRGQPGDGREFDGLTEPQKEAVNRAVINMGKALASYQRKLSCGPGRFDAWVHGDAGAITPAEQRGLKLFIGKADCIRCHTGPFFSDQSFHNVGLVPQTVAIAFRDVVDDGALAGVSSAMKDPLNSRGAFSDGDDGRLPASVPENFRGAYKTPMLRCVTRRLTFMHTGQMNNLRSVIEFFDRGGSPVRLAGKNELKPLGLSSEEKRDLLAFLSTLEGSGPARELLGP